MNAIEFAVQHIRNRIPSKILEITFFNHALNNMFGNMISIDENIRDKIIRDVVMPFINTTAGSMHDVPLVTCKLIDSGMYTGYVYNIPKSETNGRNILSIANIAIYGQFGSSPNTGPVVGSGGATPYTALAAEGLRSAGIPSNLSFTQFRYMNNNNVFLPSAIGSYPTNAVFRCYLEYDEALSVLNSSSHRVFSKLCLVAAKSYIYNELKIKIDQGFIEGGYEIGAVADIIESYSDAGEQFDEILEEEWCIASLYADPSQRKRLNNLTVGRSS